MMQRDAYEKEVALITVNQMLNLESFSFLGYDDPQRLLKKWDYVETEEPSMEELEDTVVKLRP